MSPLFYIVALIAIVAVAFFALHSSHKSPAATPTQGTGAAGGKDVGGRPQDS